MARERNSILLTKDQIRKEISTVLYQIQIYQKLRNYRNHLTKVMAETVNEDGSKTYSIGQRQVAKTQPDKKNGKGKGRKV